MSWPLPLERLMHFRVIIHDEALSRAVVRSLEIIGEATKNVPMVWRDAYPQVLWRSIAGIRDRVIHQYFDIDFEIIAKVFEKDLDKLGATVALMLWELSGETQ